MKALFDVGLGTTDITKVTMSLEKQPNKSELQNLSPFRHLTTVALVVASKHCTLVGFAHYSFVVIH